MPFLGFGEKKPQGPAVPAAELRTRLLGINRPTAPFQIVDGAKDGCDLVAEWKILDATWYELFGKAHQTEIFRIFMKFDSEKNQLRTKDEKYEVSWGAGIPSLKLSVMKQTGQMETVSFGMTPAYTEEQGQTIIKYHFSTKEMKDPIRKVVSESGWEYKGIAFGKL